MMKQSTWDSRASWPYPLPSAIEEIKAFVARLRKHIIDDEKAQNDVDEACHLIEGLALRLPIESSEYNGPTTCLGIIREGVCSCGAGIKHAGITEKSDEPSEVQEPCTALKRFSGAIFDGNPPAPFHAWSDWAASGSFEGVRIRAAEKPNKHSKENIWKCANSHIFGTDPNCPVCSSEKSEADHE